MNDKIEQSNTIESVLEKIQHNELEPYSKSYFRLKLVSLVALIASIFIVSLLFISFMFFSIRMGSPNMDFGFDGAHLQMFMVLFSWKLFIIDIVFIIFLVLLLRAFRFGYKIPVLYLMILLILVLSVLSFVLDRGIHFHERMLDRVDHHTLPFFDVIYTNTKQYP